MTAGIVPVEPKGFLHDPKRLAIRVVLTVAIGAVLLYVPQYYPRFRVEGQFNVIITYAIAALGLNLLTGYNGQISVGHGAFFGVGAYTTAILVANHGWPHFGALAVAAVVAFALGILVGLPALRIQGLYLALVTLALATVFPLVVTRFSSVTGGTQGMRVPRFKAPPWSNMTDDQWKYYVLLTFAVVAFIAVRNLIRSRVGRALIASRDNETAAETLGVNLSAYKVITFGISAMLAGIGGALSVFNEPFVNAEKYNINLSILLLVAVVVGGAATIFGPAFGAFFVVMLPVWLPKAYPQLSPVLFGGSLIVLMIVAPGGFLGLARQVTAWAKRKIRPSPGDPPGPPGTAEDGALASVP
ncbi:MAG TPA: branched-chain amino acid ABC transporter permease [Acidimicrobiales bacterium]